MVFACQGVGFHFAVFIWTPNLHVFDLWISNFFLAQKSASKYPESNLKKKRLRNHRIGWFPWLACFSPKRATDDRKPTFHTHTLQEVISTFPSRCCPTAIACAWLSKDAHHHLKTGPLMTSLKFFRWRNPCGDSGWVPYFGGIIYSFSWDLRTIFCLELAV